MVMKSKSLVTNFKLFSLSKNSLNDCTATKFLMCPEIFFPIFPTSFSFYRKFSKTEMPVPEVCDEEDFLMESKAAAFLTVNDSVFLGHRQRD